MYNIFENSMNSLQILIISSTYVYAPFESERVVTLKPWIYKNKLDAISVSSKLRMPYMYMFSYYR